MKPCVECGTEFTSRTNQRYCTKQCQERVAARKYREGSAERRAEYQAAYRQRPEAKERARLRLLRPEVAETRRAYRRRPDVNARSVVARRLWAYGMTRDEFDGLFARQGGRCGICGTPGARDGHDGLYIDHAHQTGATRGLLCRDCNHGLAAIDKHGAPWALRALAYLDEPPAQKTSEEEGTA